MVHRTRSLYNKMPIAEKFVQVFKIAEIVLQCNKMPIAKFFLYKRTLINYNILNIIIKPFNHGNKNCQQG